MNKVSKKVTTIAWFLLCCLALAACNDEKLAKQMEGTWCGSYKTAYDNGAKETIEKTITFHYDENDEWEDGGTFEEMLSGNAKDIELIFADGTMNCRYHSYIKGTWSVDFGDLYLTYNVTTLEVEINNRDVDLKLDRFADQLGMAGYMMETLSDPKDDIVKETKKTLYKDLFRQYKQHNADEAAFGDLKVSANELSFETDDLGRMTFSKVRQ